MKAALTTLIFVLCALLAVAQQDNPFYVTNPTKGTTFKAGQTYVFTIYILVLYSFKFYCLWHVALLCVS